jgi:hypothetical protein
MPGVSNLGFDTAGRSVSRAMDGRRRVDSGSSALLKGRCEV